MTRYKSRVARRSRRRARRGTRKQSGGFISSLLGFLGFGPKTEPAAGVVDPTAAVAQPAASPAVPEGNKRFFGFFNKANTPDTATAAPPAAPPAAPASFLVGGRKTRHRRRSPHRHRK